MPDVTSPHSLTPSEQDGTSVRLRAGGPTPLDELIEAVRVYVDVVKQHAEALPADDEDWDDDHALVVSSLGFVGTLNPGCLEESEDELAAAMAVIRLALERTP
jgi:hypothetical protein